MGCGSSKNAVRVTNPTVLASKIGAVPKGGAANTTAQAPPAPPREPSLLLPQKIWVKYEDTGKRTGITLTGWDQEDGKTVEGMAKTLVANHASRLHQLGFSGVALVLFDANGAVRPPRQKIESSELVACSDMKTPLKVGTPPQWSPDAPQVSKAKDLRQTEGLGVNTPRQGVVLCSAATVSTASQGSVERMLSPRSKAYRAEVEAIVKRNSPQHKSPLYKPDEVFPDLIKRDMRSHLKSETPQEPAQQAPAPSAEEVKALQKPKAVQKQQQQAVYHLDTARVKELAMQLVGFMSNYRDKDKQALLKDLKSFLEPESWAELYRQSQLADSAWSGQGCIEWLRAYIDFVKHHGLGSKNGKLRLELRDELDIYYPGQIHQNPAAKKAYALIPAEWSILRNIDGIGLNYLLDDSEGYGMLSRWASGRFLDPTLAQKWSGPPMTRPSFGFCGQLPGISKQVSCPLPSVCMCVYVSVCLSVFR